jgi:hypothetical protein
MNMRLTRYTVPGFLAVGLWAAGNCAWAQEPAASATEAAPYRSPQALEELANLNDDGLQRRLNADPAGFRSNLQNFFPPALDAHRRSHGFAGPQEACLRTASALPCRLHLDDLIELNRSKEERGRVFANPFGIAR